MSIFFDVLKLCFMIPSMLILVTKVIYISFTLFSRPGQRTVDDLEIIYEELLHIKALSHLSTTVSAHAALGNYSNVPLVFLWVVWQWAVRSHNIIQYKPLNFSDWIALNNNIKLQFNNSSKKLWKIIRKYILYFHNTYFIPYIIHSIMLVLMWLEEMRKTNSLWSNGLNS